MLSRLAVLTYGDLMHAAVPVSFAGAEYVMEKWVHPVNARYVQLRLPFTYRKVVPTVVGYPVALTTRYPTVVSLSIKDFKIRYQPHPKTLVPSLLAVSALVQPT